MRLFIKDHNGNTLTLDELEMLPPDRILRTSSRISYTSELIVLTIILKEGADDE